MGLLITGTLFMVHFQKYVRTVPSGSWLIEVFHVLYLIQLNNQIFVNINKL